MLNYINQQIGSRNLPFKLHSLDVNLASHISLLQLLSWLYGHNNFQYSLTTNNLLPMALHVHAYVLIIPSKGIMSTSKLDHDSPLHILSKEKN